MCSLCTVVNAYFLLMVSKEILCVPIIQDLLLLVSLDFIAYDFTNNNTDNYMYYCSRLITASLFVRH